MQGSSRGLGLALVENLLSTQRALAVYATAREPEKSSGLAELSARHGARLTCLRLDVCDEESIAAAAARIADRSPRVDWLVNCAGVLHEDDLRPEKRLGDLDPKRLRRSFDVNSIGPILVAKHFVSLLAHSEAAVLANLSARIGSIEDNRLGGWYGYRASKAAQNMLTRTLSIELARRAPNVTCVALHPGTVDTDLSKPFTRGLARERLLAPQEAARRIVEVMRSVSPSDSGSFFDSNRNRVPW